MLGLILGASVISLGELIYFVAVLLHIFIAKMRGALASENRITVEAATGER